ncbi:DUF1326 domain-containing protein [Marinobacter sp. SS13-12]|uniref:DUF1326 domain-containing protein n=1 Tax=Marinobacter sp. SS13-12 TaxID=3050451 RepID=UPI0025579CF6|nr:DUF1326 domain-containing protein [Marinobacter sp. SS13-12]MDK8462661.1 DUF1326 domain-containing protein [Marinobacter sp. SS13-12]
MNTNNWKLNGHYLESCTCKEVCPCLHLGNPTEGDCTGLVAWHIDKGVYEDTSLDGLNVVVALQTPGAMADGNWKVVLYLDEAGSEPQREALAKIFGGEAGGHPAVLTSFISEVLGVEHVPIHYETTEGEVRLSVGKTASAVVHANEGQEGKPVTLHNHPFAVAPGFPATLATSESLRHQAYGLELDTARRSAAYSEFSYTGP